MKVEVYERKEIGEPLIHSFESDEIITQYDGELDFYLSGKFVTSLYSNNDCQIVVKEIKGRIK